MAAPQQPNFIAISEAYETLANQMPHLANLDAAQMQVQVLGRLNALAATVNALNVTVNALRDDIATEYIPHASCIFLTIEFTFQLVHA